MRPIICLASILAVSVLSMGVAAAPAKRELKPRPDVQLKRPDLRTRCLSESQILAKVREQGYRAGRKDMKRFSGKYLITSVRHRAKFVLEVDRCTGKILAVGPARIKIKVCRSKSTIVNLLKPSYPYAKVEKFHGPYAYGSTRVYRGLVLEKQGPRWCQVKLIVDCYTGKVLKRDTLLDTCIY